MRRRLATITATLVALLLLAAPAALAASAALVEPSDTVTDPVDLRVEIEKDSRVEPLEGVRIRLRHGGEVVGDWVDLSCHDRCGREHRTQIWGADERLDPATGAPFASDGPLANGEYELEIRADRGNVLDDIEGSERIELRVEPTAPADVAAERDGDEVTVSWSEAPEPDVTGYRVERRDGDGWDELATTSEASHVDEPGEGTHTYRVVTLRDDGRGGTLEKASSTAEVEVPDRGSNGGDGNGENGDGDGNGNGNGEDDGNGNGNGDSGNGDGNGNGDSGNGDGENGGDGDGNGNGDGDGETSSSSSRDRSSSPARAPSLSSDGSNGIPSVFGRDPDSADPDAFDEELDFGDGTDDGNGNDEGDRGDDDVVLSTPGGGLSNALDGERVATPIAFGLVLTATGLHLWRWLRVPAL